jgi:hypothetical protein
MRWIVFLVVTVATVAGVVVFTAPASGDADEEAAPIFGVEIPPFNDGKPADEAVHQTCFRCHEPAKARDFVFTRYAP